MKEVSSKQIRSAVKSLFLEIGVNVDKNVVTELEKARDIATTESSKFVYDIMVKNAKLSKEKNIPFCQDTGMAVVFVEWGNQVILIDGDVTDAVNEGVREAYSEGFFRKSVLDPLTRINTKDNTPAVVHFEFVKGDKIKICGMCKGFGSENMSRLFMLTPSDGLEGIKKAVLQTVKDASANPCPPIILGIGIGGTMEKAALMSKKCLFRELDSVNMDSELAILEMEIENQINTLNIGAMGLGGKTCLKVFIEKFPTHLAGLPVGITVQCHASRHKITEVELC